MSFSRETMIELMAFADGELEGPARERAERLVVQSQEARRVVESIRSPVIRTWLEDSLDSRPSGDGIADSVMDRLEPVAGPMVASVREYLMARRSSPIAVATALLSGLALAAAIAMYVHSANRTQAPARSDAIVAFPEGPPASPPEGESALARTRSVPVPETFSGPGRGVEVEEIDSPSHVSIFEISAMANASTPSSVVIWIDDDTGDK